MLSCWHIKKNILPTIIHYIFGLSWCNININIHIHIHIPIHIPVPIHIHIYLWLYNDYRDTKKIEMFPIISRYPAAPPGPASCPPTSLQRRGWGWPLSNAMRYICVLFLLCVWFVVIHHIYIYNTCIYINTYIYIYTYIILNYLYIHDIYNVDCVICNVHVYMYLKQPYVISNKSII